MKVSIASDHGGYDLKEYIKNNLPEVEFIDEGCFSHDSVDYPDYAKKACLDYLNGKVDFVLVICTTGIGVSMVANKFKGIRCALVSNKKQAELTRLHNNANCMALGAINQSENDALEFVKIFLNTSFSNEERHLRRINKIEN